MSPFDCALDMLEQAATHTSVSAALRERLQAPQRIHTVRIPVRMDSGEQRIFQGYRVQYNNARGPFKGGIRLHPDVHLNEVKALAFWMTLKTAVANLPLGGGKGGIIVDPSQLSQAELERLVRGYVQELAGVFGAHQDVPAPDVNTGPQEMAWFADEFAIQHGLAWSDREVKAVITGKPLSDGGSKGRDKATAQGGMFVLQKAIEAFGLPAQPTLSIQGFGNAGGTMAQLGHEAGYTVVAVSDASGGVMASDGLPVQKLLAYTQNGSRLVDAPTKIDGIQACSSNDPLFMKADVVVPAALENQITEACVHRVQAACVLELANGPTTPPADRALFERGVHVIPDILANAGGVTVSAFEWEQNLKDESWSLERVDEQLKQTMHASFEAVLEQSQQASVSLRMGAYVVGLQRLEEATATQDQVHASNERARVSG